MKDLFSVLHDKEIQLKKLSSEIVALREQARASQPSRKGESMLQVVQNLFADDRGQDIAEYALMLTVILLIVVSAVAAIGANANTMFNATATKLSAS
jgi:Flp pilus assembly pilin Flp